MKEYIVEFKGTVEGGVAIYANSKEEALEAFSNMDYLDEEVWSSTTFENFSVVEENEITEEDYRCTEKVIKK